MDGENIMALILGYGVLCLFCIVILSNIDKDEKYMRDYPQLNENGNVLLGYIFFLFSPVILILVIMYYIIKIIATLFLIVYIVFEFIYEVLRDGIWNE